VHFFGGSKVLIDRNVFFDAEQDYHYAYFANRELNF